MADEKNPNGSVADILEKLRLQMSQLDEAFGIDSDVSKEAAEDETLSPEEEAPPVPQMSTEELLRSLAKTLEPSAEEKTEASSAQTLAEETFAHAAPTEEEPAAPLTETPREDPAADREPALTEVPSTAEEPEQIDFLASLEEPTESDTQAEEPLTDLEEPADSASEEEDAPVFVKEDAPVVVRKESIVPETVLTSEAVGSQADAAIVTETQREIPTEAEPAEPASHASFFVPDAIPTAAETSKPTSPPISNESRFDPSRYDEMLAAYERRRAQVREEAAEQPPVETPPPPPRSPVLMPINSPVEDEPAEVSAEALSEEPSATASAVEEAPAEVSAEVASEEPSVTASAVEEAPAEVSAEVASEEPSVTASAVEEAPAEVSAEAPSEESSVTASAVEEAPAEVSAEVPSEEPSATASAVEEAPAEVSAEAPAFDEASAKMPSADKAAGTANTASSTGSPRILPAIPEWSETDRELRFYDPTGRIRLVSSEYRIGEEEEEEKRKRPHRARSSAFGEGEEDFVGNLPSAIRERFNNYPLGVPDRTRNTEAEGKATEKQPPANKRKKKREKQYFHEEIAGTHEGDRATDYVRNHLRESVYNTRVRLIVIAVLAFILLLFENITRISLLPKEFVDTKTAGFVDALLLLVASLAAWPRLRAGVRGFFIRRIVPESILFVELAMAFLYAVVYGILGKETVFFAFVPVLGLAVLYVFRVMQCESRRESFEKLIAAGEKLVLTPVTDEKAAELAVLGDGEETKPLVYRVRKTGFVDGFSARATAVCEDERLNLALLIGTALVSLACFILTLFLKDGAVGSAVVAFLFAFFLTAPIAMCGVHIYALTRTDEVAGAESTVIGEATVREAVAARAVSFEDIEAVPSSAVTLSTFSLSCDDPSTVFKYLAALYSHIGGPLCGRFSGMYVSQSVTATPLAELVEATENGVSAAIDGAEVVVGNGEYMLSEGISPTYDAADEKILSDGKHGVIYVSVNGMICLKFYVEYGVSADFERNATYLYRRGIASILRTYDPNFTERTLAQSEHLEEVSARVVKKKTEERGDFYAVHAEGGLVTSESSTTLLSLLLLCFRTRRALRFGWVYKLLVALIGGALAVFLTVLGAYEFIPSVYPALYHLIWVAVLLLCTRLCIRRPDVTKALKSKKKEKKSKEE